MSDDTANGDHRTATESPVATLPVGGRRPSRIERLLSLLREYRDTLDSLAEEARGLAVEASQSKPSKQPAFNTGVWIGRRLNLDSHYQKLRPPCEELARYASGLIEHGRLGALRLIELRLRLADFEYALQRAEQTFSAVR